MYLASRVRVTDFSTHIAGCVYNGRLYYKRSYSVTSLHRHIQPKLKSERLEIHGHCNLHYCGRCQFNLVLFLYK